MDRSTFRVLYGRVREALGRLPGRYPRLFERRSLFAAGAVAVVLAISLVVLLRADSDPENAYAWSRIYVRKVVANPKAAEFPPFPGDEVEVTRGPDGETFTVRSEVTTESTAGLRIRHTYTAELRHRRWQNEWELIHLDLD